MCPEDCNRHGDCIDKNCWCDWGWYNETCGVNGLDDYGKTTWRGFQTLFIIMYGILFISSFVMLSTQLHNENARMWKQLIYRVFHSPRNLSFLLLLFTGAFRVIWLGLDPLGFSNILSHTMERVLYEIAFPFIYGIYSCILLVWAGLYQGMSSKHLCLFKILRKMIVVFMIIAFPMSLTFSILKGQRFRYESWRAAYYTFVIIGVVLLTLGFIVFGIMLIIYIEKNTYQNDGIIKPHRLTKSASVITPRMSKRGSILLDNAEEVHWNSFCVDKTENKRKYSNITMFSEVAVTYKLEKPEGNTCISVITKDDRTIFRKISVLFAVSVALGGVVIVFLMMLSYRAESLSPQREIISMFFILFTESTTCMLMFVAFTIEIKVKEKQQLVFFSLLAKKIKTFDPQIAYPDSLKHISSRLYRFYS